MGQYCLFYVSSSVVVALFGSSYDCRLGTASSGIITSVQHYICGRSREDYFDDYKYKKGVYSRQITHAPRDRFHDVVQEHESGHKNWD